MKTLARFALVVFLLALAGVGCSAATLADLASHFESQAGQLCVHGESWETCISRCKLAAPSQIPPTNVAPSASAKPVSALGPPDRKYPYACPYGCPP